MFSIYFYVIDIFIENAAGLLLPESDGCDNLCSNLVIQLGNEVGTSHLQFATQYWRGELHPQGLVSYLLGLGALYNILCHVCIEKCCYDIIPSHDKATLK